jgi:hypothetical protein
MSKHRDVAFEALRHYDVSPQGVRLSAESFNSVFRVTTDSAVYALRVGAALQIHPEGGRAFPADPHDRAAVIVSPLTGLVPIIDSSPQNRSSDRQ